MSKKETAMKRNEAVLNELPGEIYTIEANDKIADNCKYQLTLIQAFQNQMQISTGGLQKLLKLKIGAKVMLTVYIDTNDCLINGKTEIIRYIAFAQGSACKIYVKFSDEQGGLKVLKTPYLRRQNS